MVTSDKTCGSFDLLNALPAEQQTDLLRRLIDVIPDAILAHGPDGDLVFWSDGACTLLGYNREELSALKPFGWVEAEAMRGAPGRLETILHDGNLTFESRVVCKDGTVLPTVVTSRRIDTRMGPLIVAVIRDISGLKTAQDQLEFLANHDPLTGVANRTAFEERAGVAVADANRHGDQLALAHLDLDQLKLVNDQQGRSAGDAVLTTVAERLSATVRQGDLVARISSDEFIVLLCRIRSTTELGVMADRLLAAVNEPVQVDGAPCQTSATCGFALFDPSVDDLQSFQLKADLAMRAAKRDSQASWLLWSEDLGSRPGSSA